MKIHEAEAGRGKEAGLSGGAGAGGRAGGRKGLRESGEEQNVAQFFFSIYFFILKCMKSYGASLGSPYRPVLVFACGVCTTAFSFCSSVPYVVCVLFVFICLCYSMLIIFKGTQPTLVSQIDAGSCP